MNFKLLLLIVVSSALNAQQILLPEGKDWNVLMEGRMTTFHIGISDSTLLKHFSILGAENTSIAFDTLGNFKWQPDFDVVTRLEKMKEFSFFIEAILKDGSRIRQPIALQVFHTNRPPVVEDLPVFYVKQASGNSYQISSDFIFDPDNELIK